MNRFRYTIFFFLVLIVLPITTTHADCTCDSENEDRNATEARKYKFIAIVSILFASGIGVFLPVLGRVLPALAPENNGFFLVKAVAAGVILATGFVHVLPDAFESLTSPCLSAAGPWADYPFAGLVAMASAIGTLMVDTFATSYFKRSHFTKPRPVGGDEESFGDHVGHAHVHTHATHGHAHGVLQPDSVPSSDLLRHRIISQVLELGIVVHSVIIGISLGASESPKTIKPLLVALTFHQFFEGMGLGGCIAQAKFKTRAVIIMAIFFSLTTPIGIAIGFGISSTYDENSPTALIVEGIFNSASAGILIYMALVDLLAADFMNPRMQSNLRLQLGANLALFLGAGLMSLLAKWA